MRINGHAHVFSLQSVLSREAVEVMVGRLRRMGLRDFIVDAVAGILDRQLDRPEYLVEDELLVRFMEGIRSSASFKGLLSNRVLPVEVRLLGNSRTKLEVRGLRAALDRLSSWIDAQDGPGKSPFDVFETLRIAMQPSIPRVADKLLKHMGPDDALVALMMDITAPDEPDRDRRNFLGQIRGTMEAALARPGRILPFIGVNPRRPDHFDLMRRAVEEQGFVGVKLYPSLGFEVGTEEMSKVLDYCREKDVPITIHATSTGFNKDDVTAGFAHPKHWAPLLVGNDPLRICFAHCGGWGGFCGLEEAQVEWAEQILGFMDRPHVYADLSYHVDMMIKGGETERSYFRELKALLASEKGERIVFGTDSWLLRLSMDDAAYWRYFESKLTRAEFEIIARRAPARFLGLPLDGMPARPNIVRHVEWLERNAGHVGATPARWVGDYRPDIHWTVVRLDPGWSRNNRAHQATYDYFQGQIPPRLRRGGFDDAGALRLRQLDYFGGRGPSAVKLKGNAMNLVVQCRAFGGVPEPGYDLQVIQERLEAQLAEGDRTLAEVAAGIDAMLRFSHEVFT